MPAETLNCPMCGAPVSAEAAACDHCGSRLASVACPSCFGMMFAGQNFCPHCGAKFERAEDPAAGASVGPCPRCKTPLQGVLVGKHHLQECPHCEGIWTDNNTLNEICADHEEQAAVLGMASHLPPEPQNPEPKIQYLPCPLCHELMNRVNFAHCSHVIVDVCATHGTWFDHDDLRHIVEFIQAGGIEKARVQQIDNLQQERHALEFQRASSFGSSLSGPSFPASRNDLLLRLGIGAAAVLLRMLIR